MTDEYFFKIKNNFYQLNSFKSLIKKEKPTKV